MASNTSSDGYPVGDVSDNPSSDNVIVHETETAQRHDDVTDDVRDTEKTDDTGTAIATSVETSNDIVNSTERDESAGSNANGDTDNEGTESQDVVSGNNDSQEQSTDCDTDDNDNNSEHSDSSFSGHAGRPTSSSSSRSSSSSDLWKHGELDGPFSGIWEKINAQREPQQPPLPSVTASDRLKELHQTRIRADVTFVFPSGETLVAHKLILAMRCEKFEDLFYGTNAKDVSQVMVDDADFKTFEAFVTYFYTDETKLLDLSPHQTVKFLQLAGKYKLHKLQNEAASFLNITIDNVCQLHEKAMDLRIDALSKRTKEFMTNHIARLAWLDDITLSLDSVFELISNENLACSERDIFQFAYRWSENECAKKGIDATGDNRREVLGKALYEIRFPVMDSIAFTMLVTPAQILSPEEQKQLVQFFISRTSPAHVAGDHVLNFHSLPRKGFEVKITIPRSIENPPREDMDAAMARLRKAIKGGDVPKQSRPSGRGSKQSILHRKRPGKTSETQPETSNDSKVNTSDWGGFPRIVLSTTHKMRLEVLKPPTVVLAHIGNIEIHDMDRDTGTLIESVSTPAIYSEELRLNALKFKSEIIVPAGKNIHILLKSNELYKNESKNTVAAAGNGYSFNPVDQLCPWKILNVPERVLAGEFCCTVSVIPLHLESLIFHRVD